MRHPACRVKRGSVPPVDETRVDVNTVGEKLFNHVQATEACGEEQIVWGHSSVDERLHRSVQAVLDGAHYSAICDLDAVADERAHDITVHGGGRWMRAG